MSDSFNKYKKEITGFGTIEKNLGQKINSEIKMDSDYNINQNGGDVVLFYLLEEKPKNNKDISYPFLCNI